MKKVNIKTNDQKRVYVTAILRIITNDTKLPIQFVFKGKPFL